MSDKIEVSSRVNARTKEPEVMIKWGTEAGLLSPEAAVQHAADILEVTAGAFADGFLVRFMQERVGVSDPGAIAVILGEFRAFREDRVLKSVVQKYEEESP